ncbi:MAG: prephenate dehydratase [Lachnospiraceae bacterium]|nr:prephenate dehydratase [Lachnospiraceae bacterium]
MVVDLAESRKKIDVIDKQIVDLFEERMKVSSDVAKYKRSTGKKVYDPERENQKLEALRGMVNNDFNKTAVEDLFRQIMSISRKYQYKELGAEALELPFRMVDKLSYDEDTRVVFFGDRGAYTEQAMVEFFGENISAYNKTTFAEVIEDVSGQRAKFGVLPIENTSTGGITDIYDLLVDTDLTVVAEHVVKVEHALLGVPGANVSDIKTVYSHPQGIMQCSEFLKAHPDMKAEKFLSTAGAARKVSEDKDKSQGAIASKRAAKVFGLDILQEEINSQSQNYTRFIVVSNQKVFLSNANKISLSFEIKHEAGSLYNMLAAFYYNDLNMTKIESRPIEGRNWEYRFFVDLEGNLLDPGVSNALECVMECTNKMQILGNIVTK